MASLLKTYCFFYKYQSLGIFRDGQPMKYWR